MAENFRLSSEDSAFNNRVSSLFNSLENVASELPKNGNIFESSTAGLKRSHQPDPVVAPDDKVEGGFKVPQGCPSRKKRQKGLTVPDYLNNPNGWTFYDMRDTKELDEGQNKRAALQLVEELRAKALTQDTAENMQGDNNEDMEVETCQQSEQGSESNPEDMNKNEDRNKSDSMICNKVKYHSTACSDFGGTKKFVMEEYVVGSKKVTKKCSKTKVDAVKPNKTIKEVKLSYLSFEDDSDESN